MKKNLPKLLYHFSKNLMVYLPLKIAIKRVAFFVVTVFLPFCLLNNPSVCFLDGQGFIREHKSKGNETSKNRNEYAFQFYEEEKQQSTTLDFMLVSNSSPTNYFLTTLKVEIFRAFISKPVEPIFAAYTVCLFSP